MEITYEVSKEKGGQWYAHRVGSKVAIPGSRGDKKTAMKVAANCMSISLKEYMKLRKVVQE